MGTGAIVVGGQSRDLTFKSPESFRPKTFLFDLEKEVVGQDMSRCTYPLQSQAMANQSLTHLCIMAKRSSVVRLLFGDVIMMSSSTLASSIRGESELSLGVESAKHNIPITYLLG